jgi:hypothetical protein
MLRERHPGQGGGRKQAKEPCLSQEVEHSVHPLLSCLADERDTKREPECSEEQLEVAVV